MTTWNPFPCDLEKCFYDLELKSGFIIHRVWPKTREGKHQDFARGDIGIIDDLLIARVRVHDESNKDTPILKRHANRLYD